MRAHCGNLLICKFHLKINYNSDADIEHLINWDQPMTGHSGLFHEVFILEYFATKFGIKKLLSLIKNFVFSIITM